MPDKNDPAQRSSMIQEWEAKYVNWFNALSSLKQRNYLIVAVIVATVLVAATSTLAFFNVNEYIYAIVGFPAGVILALVLYIFIEIKKQAITNYKERTLPRIRNRQLLIAWGIALPLLIVSASGIPNNAFTGVGGMLVVAGFIFSVDIILRTDDEYYYFVNGLVDPREEMEEEEE